MGFVKLDCRILDSTIWVDRPAREVFITALLMAEPREFLTPVPTFAVRSTDATGETIPAGWYGFAPAAGPGIVRRAGIGLEDGLAALERLCSPDAESRSPEFAGMRMARVDGGYIILNFMKYRDRDYTGAERARRYRERKKCTERHAVTDRDSNVTVTPVTQSECRVQSAENTVRESPASAVVAAWNAACPPLPKCLTLSKKREAAVVLRLKDEFWRTNYAAAIARASTSDFALGKTDRGTWRMDFEFFIKPDSVAKIMEGKYDNPTGSNEGRNGRSFSARNDYSLLG